jgi:hypothetical protein
LKRGREPEIRKKMKNVEFEKMWRRWDSKKYGEGGISEILQRS